jgi:hypothetical protein
LAVPDSILFFRGKFRFPAMRGRILQAASNSNPLIGRDFQDAL